MKIKTVAIIISMLILTACTDPKSYQINSLTSEQKQEVLNKLNDEEKGLYVSFIMRQAFIETFGKEEDKQLLKTITVGQAIQKQKEWIVQQKEEEKAQAALKAKVEQEKKAFQENIKSIISLALVDKKNIDGEYGQKYVLIEMALENKGKKDIEGIKGVVKISDIFDEKIINSSFSYDEGIPAGSIAKYNPSIRINQFMSEHKMLWTTDFKKMKVTIEPEIIIFTDGTKLEIKE